MFKLLGAIIISTIIPIDIAIKFNGSKIVFTKEGDIIIEAARSIIENGKYHFTNCTALQIHNILYRQEIECLQPSDEEI